MRMVTEWASRRTVRFLHAKHMKLGGVLGLTPRAAFTKFIFLLLNLSPQNFNEPIRLADLCDQKSARTCMLKPGRLGGENSREFPD